MLRLFFARVIGDIYSVCKCSTRLSKVPNKRGKWNDLKIVCCKPLIGSKAEPLPQKQSVKFSDVVEARRI